MKRLHTLLTTILIVAVIILLWEGCGTQKAYKNLLKISQLDSIFYQQQKALLLNKRDSLGRHTIEQRQMILAKDQAYALLKLDNENLKRINARLNVRLENKQRELMLAYQDTGGQNMIIVNPINPDTRVPVTGKYMKVPRPFAYSDKFLSVFGRVTEEGVKIDSMMNTEQIQVTIGRKKTNGFKGFFKPALPIVRIRSDNPNSTITSSDNVIIDNRTKWDKLSLGLYVGYGLSVSKNQKPLVSPSFQIGIGLGWRLFPWKRHPF